MQNKNTPNIEEICLGSALSTNPCDLFDLDWYNKDFLNQMRKIQLNNIKIETFSESIVPLKDAVFISNKLNANKINDFINIVFKCCHNNNVKKESIDKWKNIIWDDIKIFEIDDLISQVRNNHELLNDPKLTIYNDFLGFIWNYDKNLLYNNEIVPDMNLKLHSIAMENNNFRSCNSIPNEIVELMEFIKIPWKSTHINKEIHSIQFFDDKLSDAQNTIIAKTKNDKNICFDLMKYVLENDSFRKDMFNIVVEIGKRNFREFVLIKNIDRSIWEYADSYVLLEISKEIAKYDQNQVKNHLSFFKKFILLFIKNFKKDEKLLFSATIIPNANCKLKSFNELKNKIVNTIDSNDLHNYLNNIFIENNLGIDFNDKIIHPDIIDDEIRSKKDVSISDYLSNINDFLKSSKIDNETKIKIAKSIVSMIPENKTTNDLSFIQNKLFDFYTNFYKLDKILIDKKFYYEYYWKISNEIVISQICDEVANYKTISNFIKCQNKNENECFDILNSLYEFAQNYNVLNQYPIIPNISGSFKKKNELSQNPGIDKELINCIKKLEPQSPIQENIVDQRVKISNLTEFTFLDFYQKMNKMFANAIEKGESNVKEMIYRINNVEDTGFFEKIITHKMTKDEEFKMNILIDAHVNFVRDYIREIDFRSEILMKRWPFELIQNANDTVKGTDKKVSITFEVREDKVIFKHNGEPFDNKSLLAILYQCSNGKENTTKTGKFGTGFLSTLILSREINVSGDLINKDNEENTGFDLTVYRHGKTSEDIINGIKKMEGSIKKGRPKKGITTFEYILKKPFTDETSKVIEQGIESLEKNISPILIFNENIESITIITNKGTKKYILDQTNIIFKEIKKDKFSIKTVSVIDEQNKSQSKEKFFVADSIKKFNINKFHQKFKATDDKSYEQNNDDKTMDVKINSMIKINIEKNSIEHDYQTTFFSSYPLFGIENMKSPFIINSPDFELEKERQFLLIESEDRKYQKKESLINQFIIMKCACLYKTIVEMAVNKECSELYNLFRGLNDDDDLDNENDDGKKKKSEFIHNNFTKKIRSYIEDFPFFETESGLEKYDKVIIPFIDYSDEFGIKKKNDERKAELYKTFYDFVSEFKSINSKSIIPYEYCKNWESLLWKDFKSNFNIDDFIQFLSSASNVSNLNISSKDKFEFVKDVIKFIKQMKNSEKIFMEKTILFNEHGKFQLFKNLYKINFHDVAYEIMNIVKYDYKKFVLHPEIQFLYNELNFTDFTMENASGHILKRLTYENSIDIMQFVTGSYFFSSNRQLMFKYTKKILKPDIQQRKMPNDIDKQFSNIFNKADENVCHQLANKIVEYDELPDINFKEFSNLLKNFLKQKEYKQINFEKLLFKKSFNLVKNDILSREQEYDNFTTNDDKQINIENSNTKNAYNFKARNKKNGDNYYFIVKQSDYFSYNKIKFNKYELKKNEHLVLAIVYDIEEDNVKPEIVKFELMK